MGNNPFALNDDDTQDIVNSLLAATELRGERYTVHVTESLDDAALLGLRVTAKVFDDAFGNSDELLLQEYAEYLPSMLHVIVCDADARKPVGSIGLLRTTAAQLKTVVDVASEPWSIAPESTLASIGVDEGSRSVWDIATFAVLPEVRRSRVAIALLHAGYLASMRAGVYAWTAILDDVVLRGVDALTRGAFQAIPGTESKPYLGSSGSTPTFALVPYEIDLTGASSWITGRGLERTYAFADHGVSVGALVN